jgi:hypothetical protein
MSEIFKAVELPRFFETEEFRKLDVSEDLKKKVLRWNREASEFLRVHDFGNFLGVLFTVAGFYSEKIVPEVTESDQKLARRLELVLWRELQYYAEQFSQFYKNDLLTQITDEASLKLLEVASHWLTLNHIAHEKKSAREIAADGLEVDYPSLTFLPDEATGPGRLAKKLATHATNPVALCFTPTYTGSLGWAGKMTEVALHVSPRFVLELQIDSDTGHELYHWRIQTLLTEGTLNEFHGDVVRDDKRPFPDSAGAYQQGLGFDELAAYGYNMARAKATLEQEKDPKRLYQEMLWAMADAKTGKETAQAIQEILNDALATLKHISDSREVTRVRFTSNRTGNMDSRPSLSYCLGTDLDHHFGFQLADFRKPKTEHVRLKLVSTGWIFGLPIVDKGTLTWARKIAKSFENGFVSEGKRVGFFRKFWHQKRLKAEFDFFQLLKNVLLNRYKEQRELAVKMEKDFANVQTVMSMYLTRQNEESQKVLTETLGAFTPYGKHGFEE